MSILKPIPMTEQQQKLLQEAKDAVAKIIGYKDFAEYHKFWEAKSCIPNQSISEQFMNDVAIKYNELCEADKSTELQSLILTRSGSIHHSFVDINEQLNEYLKGANIIPKHTFTNYDSNSQVASLTLFYTQPPK